MSKAFGKLDTTSICDTPVEFEYMGADGVTNTGFFVSVLGQYSKKVQDAVIKMENRDRLKAFEARKRGKAEEPKDAKDEVSDTIALIAARVAGWRGTVSGDEVPEFSEENAIELIRVNHIIRGKVLEISNDVVNFTMSK
jgi:hypothetical protein